MAPTNSASCSSADNNDNIYCAPQQLQQENWLEQLSRTKPMDKSPAMNNTSVDSDNLNALSSMPSVSVRNLYRFLDSAAPVVTARQKSCIFYYLGDLWEFYKESSNYGNEVPFILNGEEVVQYYTPFLSGIQLFVDTSKPSLRSRWTSY